MKTLHLIAGLPRSGSTLLCNILLQNSRFHAEGSSGLLDLLVPVRNGWNNVPFLRALPEDLSETKRLNVLRAVVEGFYADVEQLVVFDKNRGWLRYLELIEAVLGRPVRVLVCVRDLRDVLASFEMLWRRTSALGQMTQEVADASQFHLLGNRCAYWVRADQPVGFAYNCIRDALARGYRDRLHFVRYELLTAQPAQTLTGIYEYLDEEPFAHDFEHVEQKTWEDDRVHGVAPGALHGIRSAVRPQPARWPTILGRAADLYQGQEVW